MCPSGKSVTCRSGPKDVSSYVISNGQDAAATGNFLRGNPCPRPRLHRAVARHHCRPAHADCRARIQAGQKLDELLSPALVGTPSCQACPPHDEIATPFRRPAWPRQAPTASAPHRAMPARHPVCAADLPPLRCTPERHRSPTPAAPGVGIARNQA